MCLEKKISTGPVVPKFEIERKRIHTYHRIRFHLYKTDQNTVEYLKEWKTEELEELADFMYEVTGDNRYDNVMDMGITQF